MRVVCSKHGKTEGRMTGSGVECALCAREALPWSAKRTFVLVPGLSRRFHAGSGDAIRCLRCGRTSYNPHDVAYRFCGACGFHPPQKET